MNSDRFYYNDKVQLPTAPIHNVIKCVKKQVAH